MNTLTKIILALIAIALLVFGISRLYTPSSPAQQQAAPQPTNSVSYSCSAGKTITAAFYAGTGVAATSTSPDQPPTPTGSVALTLSDGRTMTLPQTISADGGRYANADESFVFWSKGNTALIQQNNAASSFANCILLAPEPTTGEQLPQTYSTSTPGFSIRLPGGYTPNESYKYQELGPGKSIPGIKFTIPATTATGTNLSKDSFVSVESIPDASICTAALFIQKGITATIVNDGDSQFSVASSSDAGAGNRYEETVYAYPGTNPCIAVRYFIHYSVFENYPAGTVKEFDKKALLSEFDAIRRTLVIAQ